MSTHASSDRLGPGACIGILGGGQLGRMLVLAAARLGLTCHVFTDRADDPALGVVARSTVAAFDDEAALRRFAGEIDVATFEFENVPVRSVEILAEHVPVRPGARALAVAQDRLSEKRFARSLGIATAPFVEIGAATEIAPALAEVGTPAILKTRRFGYDGKGQVRIRSAAESAGAFAEIGAVPAILEGVVDFSREISIICTRGLDGAVASYDPAVNEHRNHILHTSRVPADLTEEAGRRLACLAADLATALDYVGVMGIELFETRDGSYLLNEIAPRVHNSGHWTIEACAISQFEQHVRAVCGWPLGCPARHSDAVMTNLIGEDIAGWAALAAEPWAAVHIYGKSEARPGRKMGHVTRLTRRTPS